MSVWEMLPNSDPANWPISCSSAGDRFVTTEQIADLLGVRPERVSRSLSVPRRDKRMLCVTKGGWVPVMQGHLSGTQPPFGYIDEMMGHLGHTYCLGYRSAADMYGASHFGCHVVQVITTARLRGRLLGTWPLVFVTRPDLDRVPILTRPTGDSLAKVTSPEVTVLDLVARPDLAGGPSDAMTLIGELLRLVPSMELCWPMRPVSTRPRSCAGPGSWSTSCSPSSPGTWTNPWTRTSPGLRRLTPNAGGAPVGGT